MDLIKLKRHLTTNKLLAIFIVLFSFPELIYSQVYTPGEVYYDSTGYVEYRAGNLPIILSAPHGGSLMPSNIPDRDCSGCSYVQDRFTQTITEETYDEFVQETGCYPHVIINLLHRIKFDANRDIGDAADGNPIVEQAWYGYHDFIDAAKDQIVSDYGKGIFLDIHGHAHSIQRIELGYLLSGSELRLSDAELDTSTYIEESSIKSLVGNNIQGYTHSNLLRGTESFGSLLDNNGFPSVPSLSDPFPDAGESYFSGGYNTGRHGSRDNDGTIDAIQIELNQDARFDLVLRELLIVSLTRSANEYIDYHYNNEYLSNYCNLILDVPEQNRINKEIKIYPNPANSYFSLKTDLKEIEVMIYNNLGQIVHSEIWSEKKIEIDFLQDGYYFVQLRKDNSILSNLKLIKQ